VISFYGVMLVRARCADFTWDLLSIIIHSFMLLFSAAYICGKLFECFNTCYMIPLNASYKMFRSCSSLFVLQVANLSPIRADVDTEAETEAEAHAEAIFVFF
jgi:hypothetical protein